MSSVILIEREKNDLIASKKKALPPRRVTFPPVRAQWHTRAHTGTRTRSLSAASKKQFLSPFLEMVSFLSYNSVLAFALPLRSKPTNSVVACFAMYFKKSSTSRPPSYFLGLLLLPLGAKNIVGNPRTS